MMVLVVRDQFSREVSVVQIFLLHWPIINNMEQSNVEKMYSDHFVGGKISSSAHLSLEFKTYCCNLHVV